LKEFVTTILHIALELWFTCSTKRLYILNSSDHFNRIRMGRWPPMRPGTMIGTLPLTLYYYRADGIYPRWRIFATSITDPRTVKEAAISRQQEAARKESSACSGALSAVSNLIPSLPSVAYEIHAKCRAGVRRLPQHGGHGAQASLRRHARRRTWWARAAERRRAHQHSPADSHSTCTGGAPWPSRWRAVPTISV
jgi:Plant transposon protein